MKGKRAKKIDSVTLTVDLDQFTNSVPKRYVIPYTESKYETKLQYFDKYHELHPDSTVPPNYQTFKSFLVWVSKLMDGRIKSSPWGKNPDGTPRLLPCVDTVRSFLRSFLTA